MSGNWESDDMFGVGNSIVRLRIVTMRLKEWKRKLEPVENVELLHKELDAGGHEQVGQVVAVDLITKSLILKNDNDLRSNVSIKQGGRKSKATFGLNL